MVQAFTEGVEMLPTVQNAMRTASEAFTHDGLTQPSDVYELYEATQVSEATHGATQGATLDVSGDETIREMSLKTVRPRRRKPLVIYVKMRRRERANVVVLSSDETYCYAKAAFDPVIDYLAGLSSPAFYAALQSWREIVRNGMTQSGVCSTDATTGPDENSGSDGVVDDESISDAVSEIEPADLIDTMRMIREMEQHDHNRSVAGAESRHAPDGNQQHSVDVKPNSHSSDRSSFTAMKTLTQTWEPKPYPLTTESASPKQASLLTKAAVKPNNLLTKASAKQNNPLTKAIAHLKKKTIKINYSSSKERQY
ncbi:hypothetical protein PC129_g7696 [Phytophthora cactorum]|uniref:Uncharacterized protein n=1 Tax=Phytophthora cactorum TaxID=29920 RepID=A0A8T0Z7M5_9STRA|nr:hypothetical protein Pcac1_g9912 [Phytophthora cactorum]KAG2793111.1 hypothetical protein PC111_g23170 [Phytophthora cactorum]KAG2858194.1 hypothetical protein PC113_g10018 [Phytophthora cactorum]KAG2872872.1 hypothetical protein PC114_g26146 [Phytophthora cactorum]KAG2958687.1 hypothetical protein PC118_g23398 [Phytophthora cactorum]